MKPKTNLTRYCLDEVWHPFAIAGAGIILILIIAQTRSLSMMAMLILLSIIILRMLGVKIQKTCSLLRYFLWMLPVTFLMHLIFSQEGWGFIRYLGHGEFHWELLRMGGLFTLKIFGFLYVMGGLLQLIRADRFLESLFRTFQPLQKWHFPVNGLLQIMNLGIRFFPLLRQEMQQIQEISRGLGVGESSGLRRRIITRMKTITPLFIGTLHRGEILSRMMVLRGYRPGRMRTTYSQVRWHLRDSLMVCVALSMGVIALI